MQIGQTDYIYEATNASLDQFVDSDMLRGIDTLASLDKNVTMFSNACSVRDITVFNLSSLLSDHMNILNKPFLTR